MRWLFMLVNLAAMGLFFGIEPRIGFYLTFMLLTVNFATFCLLYDAPLALVSALSGNFCNSPAEAFTPRNISACTP